MYKASINQVLERHKTVPYKRKWKINRVPSRVYQGPSLSACRKPVGPVLNVAKSIPRSLSRACRDFESGERTARGGKSGRTKKGWRRSTQEAGLQPARDRGYRGNSTFSGDNRLISEQRKYRHLPDAWRTRARVGRNRRFVPFFFLAKTLKNTVKSSRGLVSRIRPV